jgi:5-methylcytosine-specific restriction endonuclease McrA
VTGRSWVYMQYDDDTLRRIYDSTSGKCHLCHKKLSISNHGVLGAKGAWDVDHSIPVSEGGTDHLNNLKPACIRCNRSKGAGSTRSFRVAYGNTRAPLSVTAERRRRRNRELSWAVALLGLLGVVLAVLAKRVGTQGASNG